MTTAIRDHAANAVFWAVLHVSTQSDKNHFECRRCRAEQLVLRGPGVSEQHDRFAIHHAKCVSA